MSTYSHFVTEMRQKLVVLKYLNPFKMFGQLISIIWMQKEMQLVILI